MRAETEAQADVSGAVAVSTVNAHPDHSPLQALRNIVTSYGALFVGSLSNILLTPLLLGVLGTTDYGIMRVASSLFGYIGLLDLGISTSIIYFVARYDSVRQRVELDRYISTIFNSMALLAVAAMAFSAIAASSLAVLLGAPPETVETAAWVIRISGVMFAANVVGGVFGGVLVGRGRYDVNNAITIFDLAINAIGTFVLLRLGYGLIPIVVFNTVIVGAGAGIRVLAVSIFQFATVVVGRIYISVLRNAASYGFWSFLNNLASQLSFATTDMIILARVAGVSSVSLYSVALAPVALISSFVFQFVDVFQPMITNIAYRRGGDVADVGRAFLLLTKTSILLGWGPVLLLWLAGRQLLEFWVGDIGLQAGELLIALTFAYGWNFIGHAAGLVLLGIAKHRILGITALIGSANNVVLSAVLAMNFGPLGVAFGTIIVMGITEIVVLPVYTCRQVSVPVRAYVYVVGRTAVGLLIAFGTGLAVGEATLELLGPWGATAAQCLAGGLVFLGAFWFVVCERDDRSLLVDVVRGILQRR